MKRPRERIGSLGENKSTTVLSRKARSAFVLLVDKTDDILEIIQSKEKLISKGKEVLIMKQGDKTKVIVVTDGDKVAKESIQTASKSLGLRCISLSAGNPTPLTPEETVELIMQAKADPVVVMVDDRGIPGEGAGERVLRFLAKDTRVDLLGVVAVASNTPSTAGVEVDCSITKTGQIYSGSVDKTGFPESIFHEHLEGDTVDVLNELNVPVVIGIGDIGKMDGLDDCRKGAPNTTLALKEVLERSGQLHGDCRKN